MLNCKLSVAKHNLSYFANIKSTMDKIWHGDLFNHLIVKHLEIKDLYRLQIADGSFNNTHLIKKLVLAEINSRLSTIFGKRLSEFKDILERTGSVISGSFIIQCILSEHWDDSDIDIYVPIKNNVLTKTPSGNDVTEIERFLFEEMKYEFKDYDHYGVDLNSDEIEINFVRNYKVELGNYKTIQIIQVNMNNNVDKLNDFILESFDFDIFKNKIYINNKDIF
jgi:hypothetical protein